MKREDEPFIPIHLAIKKYLLGLTKRQKIGILAAICGVIFLLNTYFLIKNQPKPVADNNTSTNSNSNYNTNYNSNYNTKTNGIVNGNTGPVYSIPTPIPSPTPPPPSVKRIGDRSWRVVASGNSWVSTNIPVIIGIDFKVDCQNCRDNTGWLMKLGGKTFYSKDRYDVREFEVSEYPEIDGLILDHDFKDTLKFRLKEESPNDHVILVIHTWSAMMRGCQASDDESKAIHEDMYKWHSSMLLKTQRN